jgi:hypothetical protein
VTTDPREEWILERMAIMEEGATREERRRRVAGDLRRLAEQDWERLQQARNPKKQRGMF